MTNYKSALNLCWKYFLKFGGYVKKAPKMDTLIQMLKITVQLKPEILLLEQIDRQVEKSNGTFLYRTTAEKLLYA